MSDENKEEKKPEELGAQLPWLLRTLVRIELEISRGVSADKLRPLFNDLFSNLSAERFNFSDNESKSYEDYLEENNKKVIQLRLVQLQFSQPPTCKEIFDAYIGSFVDRLIQKKTDKGRRLLLNVWVMWGVAKTEASLTNLKIIDSLAIKILSLVPHEFINSLYKDSWTSGFIFRELYSMGKTMHFDDPENLEALGSILEKLGETDRELTNFGKNFRARAQALLVKEELKNETKKEVKTLIEESSKSFSDKASKETDDKIKKFDDKIQGVEARFIQIVGIFAAIIAFIVTMVPTAARLGGASIPVALAGLAIVTVGIILVLAMIFGKKEKVSAGLIAGVSITGVLFVGWLLLTIGLAFAKPNVLAPRPDPVRVDTLYIETSPPPTPSLMEGDM